MENLFQRIKQSHLLKVDGGPLCGVVLAGSAAYKQGLYKSLEELHDLDILLITSNKLDFSIIFHERLDDLKSAVGMDTEEYSSNNFKSLVTPRYWEHYDAIRFSGFSKESRQKITVKIIDAEFLKRILHNSDNFIVRMLSFKRVSTLYRILDDGFSIMTIGSLDNQIVSSPGETINILKQFLLWKQDKRNLIIGVFADMVLSGQILYDFDYNVASIKMDLVYKISCFLPCQNWLNLLHRISVMPEGYLKRLMRKYSQRNLTIINVDEIAKRYCLNWNICILPCDNTPIMSNCTIKNIFNLSNNLLKLNDSKISYKYINLTNVDFPTAHKFGKAYVSPTKFYFFKETTNHAAELFGFQEAQKYFSNIHSTIHCIQSENVCLYEWVNGVNLASTRMKYIQASWASLNIFGLLHPHQYNLKSDIRNFLELNTEIELLRAQEMINVYRTSKTFNRKSGIHKVFQNRYNENRFFNNYKSEIYNLPGSKDVMTIKSIMELPIVVNGKQFKNLNYFVEKSKTFLSFESFKNDVNQHSLLNCFGLGDTHCGNIMIINEPEFLRNKFIYIDYECAGYHSPFLDIAKGFAVDVFFNVYQLDVLINLIDSNHKNIPYDVRVYIDYLDGEEAIFINHKFVLDWVSYLAMKTKFHGVIESMMSDLKYGEQIERAWELFKSGVFCSLLFAKKFPLVEQLFLMIAISIEIFEADSKNLNNIIKPML